MIPESISGWDMTAAVMLALLIIDRFTKFIDKINPISRGERHESPYDKARQCRDVANMVWETEDGKMVKSRILQLHEWHDKEDDDGVKIWYIKRSLETAVNRLAENIDKQTRVLERLLREPMP